METANSAAPAAAAAPSKNGIGLSRQDYVGAKSTLCSGCGHDSITNNLTSALYQSSVNPYKVAKMSGIGCSSKTTAYFLSKSHGFNSIHGRMAPVATGAKAANRDLLVMGVSGDGDTASIGLGGFCHLMRRNVPMTYIVENNGVYGLTKGQFSATADAGSKAKSGGVNEFESIDLCALALELGCSFVARSFSGDAKQVVPLLNLALRHHGTAFIDIVSPCVTFANHEGSTRSFDAVKTSKINLHELGFIQPQQEIHISYEEGTTKEIELHDGSRLVLKKLDSALHDIRDREAATARLHESRTKGQLLTGLFYWDNESQPLDKSMALVDTPLRDLADQTRPKPEVLTKMLSRFS
jgi:2-oxoglutarate ferredoxin oxidoreductase subunit beta